MAFEKLRKLKDEHSKSLVKNINPKGVTKAFWEKFLIKAEIDLIAKWSELSNKKLRGLAEKITFCEFDIKGKNRFNHFAC